MNKMLSIKINDMRIYAREGTTILEAARQNGITIPTLCYHPRLEPLGHCRICIVHVDGIKRPVTSCDNPVTDGMIVKTDSPELREMRSQILELSLTTHPYQDCLTCVRTGTCELQDRAYQYQVNLPDQIERDLADDLKNENLYIERDEEKCILCGRCIQVCRSGAGRSVYSMVGKGVNTRVIPYRNSREVTMEEAGCIFCGQCVDVCPVAALTEKGRSAGGREWELSNVPGICIECSLGCYLERQATGDNLIKVTVPLEGEKVGWLCQKGKFGFVKGDDEVKLLSGPVKRTDQGFTKTDYNDAVSKTAETLTDIKRQSGGEALAVLASGNLSNEENYLLQKLSRSVLQTPYLDLGAEPAWIKAYTHMHEITGFGITGPTPAAIRNAKVLFIIGTGLEDSHPVAAMAVGQAGRFGDATIIRTDPAVGDAVAWKSLNLEAGENDYSTLLNALNNLAGGSNAGNKALEGIAAESLCEAASLLKGSMSYTVVCPSFFAEADQDAIEALLKMAYTCGQIEAGRSNLLLLSRFSNAAGVLASGATAPAVYPALEAGILKGLLIFGSSYAELNTDKLEFLAAVCRSEDEAPSKAEYIFPAEPIIRKSGQFTNAAGQTRLNEAVLKADAKRLPDWRLICDLAHKMGAKWQYNTLDDVREEMKEQISASC